MSSAAAVATPSRPVTGGYSKIPNSLIENQAVLTRAELAFALIALRRGGGDPVTITDRNWESWTGLSARAKEYAVRGLREKCIQVQGHGERARYAFERSNWENFVRHAERSPARTVGRSVDPKPGAKVHPECRERGCALLERENRSNSLDSSQVAQPVAPVPSGASSGLHVVPAFKPLPLQNQSTPLSSTQTAQPVARDSAWSAALAALQGCFPLAGMAFLMRLLAVVRSLFSDVSDSELAEGIRFAFLARVGHQRSEGLFLFTVPNAIAHLRRVKAPKGPPAAVTLSASDHLFRCAEVLKARGRPLSEVASRLTELGNLAADAREPAEIERLDTRLEEVTVELVRVCGSLLAPDQLASVDVLILENMKRYQRMTKEQAADLELRLRGREILRLAGVPPLTLF